MKVEKYESIIDSKDEKYIRKQKIIMKNLPKICLSAWAY